MVVAILLAHSGQISSMTNNGGWALELQGMAGTLRALAEHCHGDTRPDCPIITDLDAGGGR